MKIPERVQPLVKEGLVDEVICQFMTGKEAMVDAVRCGDGIRCAKVYKESSSSSFRRASVTRRAEGKKHRRARAMDKGTRYGRQSREDA